MNITNHAKERYVERIKGIRETNAIKQYIAQNEQMLEKHILKIYEFAEHIYTGQIGGNKTTKDFYLNGDICLVVESSCINTIFIINFAFPEKTRLTVISDLKNEIKRLQEDIETEEKLVAQINNDIDAKINGLQNEIKGLGEEIDIRRTDIEVYQATKKATRSELIRLKKQLQHYSEQLFGNTQYKGDVS